jgi:hypothetical protein
VQPDETIADMHQAIKHKPGPSKPVDPVAYTDEERSRMTYEWLTHDMPDDPLSGDSPSDGGPSDGSPSDGSPPAGSKGD